MMRRSRLTAAALALALATWTRVAAEETRAPDPKLDELIAGLAAETGRLGVTQATIDRAFAGFERDPEVVALSQSQPEHERTTGEYLGLLVSEARIAGGRGKLEAERETLARIEQATGVDRHILVAFWGVETSYGTSMGTRQVIRSLATLALEDPRRPAFWRSELAAALVILARGDVKPEAMVGSWAGAMGHTQFMPSSFNRHAVDFDGDGRRDIWATPADALASTARYLLAAGWQAGEAWGLEVTLPDGLDLSLAAPANMKPLAYWRERGLAPTGSAAWPATRLPLRLLLPEGRRGPAFLVTQNFAAILRYNPATSYALAVAHLADRLSGAPALAGRWPSERPLARAEREELQRLLTERGHDVGGVDGIIGSLTRTAVRAYQRSSGLPEDGHPDRELLARLREGAATRDGKAP